MSLVSKQTFLNLMWIPYKAVCMTKGDMVAAVTKEQCIQNTNTLRVDIKKDIPY